MTSISIDSSDPTPVFEQIRRQLAEMIELGLLAPSTKLPTVRQLARDLAIAPGTVARAYAELESTDHITTARGAGTRVCATRQSPPNPLDHLARTYVQKAKLAGASDQEISAAVVTLLDSWTAG